MAKRMIALLLAAGLLLTAAVGCGSGKKPGSDPEMSSTVSGATDSTPSAPDTNRSTSGDGSEDSSGDGVTSQTRSSTGTTKAGGSQSSSGLVSDTPVSYTLFMTEHVNQPILTNAPKWAEIAKKTNVTLKVDVGVGSSAQTKLSAAATSGKMYDITYLSNDQLKTYNAALFMEITADIMKNKTPNYYRLIKDDADLKRFTVGGKYLGFAQFEKNNAGTSPVTTAIRYDVLDKHNLAVPETWDEWFDTMKQLKKLYPDSTPFSGRWYKYILDYWEQALGMQHKIHLDRKSQKWICGVMQPEYRTVLQFMKKCYNEGILDRGFYTCNEKTFADGAAAGRVFFWIDNGMNAYKQTDTLRQTNPDALIFAMPLMTNSFGKKCGLAYTQSVNYSQMYCLSASVKDPDTLLRFMDWCYSEEGLLVNSYGRKGIDYQVDAKGVPYVPESVWKKYAGGGSLRYDWMSKLGLGQLCFAPYYIANGLVWENEVDESDKYGNEKEIYAQDVKEGNFEPLLLVSPDVDLKTISRSDTIEKFIESNVVAFIKDQRPISEFNQFINDLKKIGVEAVLKTYNAK